MTREHADIQTNLTSAMASRLRGTPRRFYGPELKVQVAGSIRYPDGFVVRTPGPRGQTVVEDPVVVFEILSPGTERADRTERAREYRATPSVRRYVMLRQDRVAAEVHLRDGDTDRWLSLLLFEDDLLAMPEIGVELPLAEFYEGVELPPLDQPTEPKLPSARWLPPCRAIVSGLV